MKEDIIKGNVAYPKTLNAYGYCWGNPVPYASTSSGEKDTIGYGHDFIKNGDKDKWLSQGSITEKEAEELLIQDIENNIPYELFRKLEEAEVYLTPNEIDAIISLAFNCGAGELDYNSPNFTKLLLSKNYTKEQIEKEFLTYLGSEDVAEGLMKRRIAEAKIFNDSVYDMKYKECSIE